MDERQRQQHGSTRFLPDGRESAADAIRAEIEAKYAQSLATADEEQARALWKHIEQEIDAVMERLAPPYGMY